MFHGACLTERDKGGAEGRTWGVTAHAPPGGRPTAVAAGAGGIRAAAAAAAGAAGPPRVDVSRLRHYAFLRDL